MAGKGNKHIVQAGRTLNLPPKCLLSLSSAEQSLGQRCRLISCLNHGSCPLPLPSDSGPSIQASSPKHLSRHSLPCAAAPPVVLPCLSYRTHNMTNAAFLLLSATSHPSASAGYTLPYPIPLNIVHFMPWPGPGMHPQIYPTRLYTHTYTSCTIL